MKIRQLFLMAILCVCTYAHTQNKQLLYDFTEVPQSLMINPGMETDFKWYSGVPTVSGISIQVGSSGLSAGDIFAVDGLDFNDKFRDQVINGLSNRDEFSGTQQIELINIGFRSSNPSVFYSMGMYIETDFIQYWPKDYGILAFEGNADRLNQEFNLGDLKTRAEAVSVFHFGINKRMNKKLTLGARAKIYSGILNVNSTGNKGFFVTREGQNNILSNTLDADLELRTSGLNVIRAADEEALASTIMKRALLGGDLGLGIDAGFTYKFNNQTAFTASILDLGFIYNSSDPKNYTLNGAATIEGVEIILPEALFNSSGDFWQDLVDDVEELVPFQENTKSYITFRPTKLNASLRYSFGKKVRSKGKDDCDCSISSTANAVFPKYLNSLGGQLYVINRPRGPQAALTAFYLRRLGRAMAIKTTYTIDKFSFANVGLGVNFQAGPVNMYFMADNFLAYQNLANAKYASLQLGLNIISWGRKK